MNRAQLTAQIAEKAGVSKAQAGKLLNTVLGCIADNICSRDGRARSGVGYCREWFS